MCSQTIHGLQANGIHTPSFIGGGQFCIKLCDPTVTSKNYCQNIFDILGCAYNMPASCAAVMSSLEDP